MSDDNKKPDNHSNIIKSFDYAIKGLVYAIKTERNMRIHIIIAIIVLLVSLFLNLSRFELMALIFAIALVLITEIINTASELIVNMVTEGHHPLAKIIKDLLAGSVLFASICAVIIGYLVFVKKDVLGVFERSMVIEKISEFPIHITVVVVFLVLFVSLFIKALREKKMSLIGGMPSIHTAVAFSVAAIIFFLSSNIYIYIFALFLAAMVGQSRISGHIHNLWEVAVGAVLGTAITVLMFQIIV